MRLRVVSLLLLTCLPAAPNRSEMLCQASRPSVQIQAFEVGLVIPGEAASGLHLIDRLKHHQVSTVSVAVVEDGELHWTRTWNADVETEEANAEVENGDSEAPDQFRADAVWPVLTATAALRAVDQERLALDDRLKAQLAGNEGGLDQSLESALGQPPRRPLAAGDFAAFGNDPYVAGR